MKTRAWFVASVVVIALVPARGFATLASPAPPEAAAAALAAPPGAAGDVASISTVPPAATTQSKPFSRVTIGVGIPAISVRLSDGKIGIMDKIAPAELNLNYFQTQTKDYKAIWWRVGLGIVLQKPTDSAGAQFGVYLTPWSMQIEKFALGVAVGYTAVDTVKLARENFSMLFPVSYVADF
jgi:hypothetical protein